MTFFAYPKSGSVWGKRQICLASVFAYLLIGNYVYYTIVEKIVVLTYLFCSVLWNNFFLFIRIIVKTFDQYLVIRNYCTRTHVMQHQEKSRVHLLLNTGGSSTAFVAVVYDFTKKFVLKENSFFIVSNVVRFVYPLFLTLQETSCTLWASPSGSCCLADLWQVSRHKETFVIIWLSVSQQINSRQFSKNCCCSLMATNFSCFFNCN